MPIAQHGLNQKGKVDSGITYNQSFAEFDACIAANLSPEKWCTGGYPRWLMAKTVAWYKNSKLIRVHTEDAKSRKMQKDSRKAGKK